MKSNQELLAGNRFPLTKADISSGDIVNNGEMTPEQSEAFIYDMLNETVGLKDCRIELMKGRQKEINKMGFSGRILRPGNVDLKDTANRSKNVPRKIELTSKKYRGMVVQPYDVIEDVIPGGSLNFNGPQNVPGAIHTSYSDQLIREIAAKVGTEIEEAAWQSDTAIVGDDFLAYNDGWIKLCNLHDVDLVGATPTEGMFADAINSLPTQYHKKIPGMKNYLSYSQEMAYRQTLAARETGRADDILEGFSGIRAYGVPVQKTAYMPNASGILTHPKNLICGIQRKVSLSVVNDPIDEEYKIVVTMRIDFQVEEADAAVRYINIG